MVVVHSSVAVDCCHAVRTYVHVAELDAFDSERLIFIHSFYVPIGTENVRICFARNPCYLFHRFVAFPPSQDLYLRYAMVAKIRVLSSNSTRYSERLSRNRPHKSSCIDTCTCVRRPVQVLQDTTPDATEHSTYPREICRTVCSVRACKVRTGVVLFTRLLFHYGCITPTTSVACRKNRHVIKRFDTVSSYVGTSRPMLPT